jgi:demethylmenaquinone methyltransferase / 2-methoxy-6-polyprenyl-1,4-benzoquinol methylase
MAEPQADPAVLPAEAEKAAAVRRMFGAIAPRYDLLNHLLSLNVDRWWRRVAVRRLLDGARRDGLFLDSCAGTMDLALALARARGFAGRVVACDFALPMLQRGLPKLRGRGGRGGPGGGAAPAGAGRPPVHPACGDALRLPFADGTFDGAMVGFGIRNVAGLEAGIAEFARVLKPGGRLVILEFATPTWRPFRDLYLFYFLRVLPWIGRRVSRHGSAYAYLPASVLQFPTPADLATTLERAGFRAVHWRTLTGGIVAVHEGVRG